MAAEGFASGDMALERLDAAAWQGESDITYWWTGETPGQPPTH
ncbi:MAG: hypothetical protein ACLR7Z_14270 [Bilophila wadsworthia]